MILLLKKTRCLFAVLLLLLIAPIKLTKSVTSQIVGMRDFANRLEGTTIQLNALNDFTFVALHRYCERFSKGSTLNVRFFLPQIATEDSKVFVEAVELQDSLHYFMTAKAAPWRRQAWNIFGPWPTRDVIDPNGIASDNVGVRAAYQIGNKTRVWLPVDVYSTDPQIPGRKYLFYYVTAQDLQSVDISVTNAHGQPVSITKPILQCNKGRNLNCLLYAAGNTLNFELDFSALSEGQYYVHLVGRIPKTFRTASAITAFYHSSVMEKGR